MLKNKLLSAMGGAPTNYIEDVFSTYLYTGTGAARTITNGIDLAGKGGLVWMKGRSGSTDHGWYDTARGATFDIASNLTTAQTTQSTGLTSFSSTGFSLGALAKLNTNAATYASCTFRKQPKFFDVVTWTGSGANRTIAHSLGSVPGCIMVKRTDTTGDWQVYHQSLANTEYMVLNSIAAKATGATRWNSTTPTSTVFSLGTDATVNASGGTYVAYILAHNAGGFGLTGTDNVISCGSYVGNATLGQEITLGYEPQWLMVKNASAAGYGWLMLDNMRGMPVDGNPSYFLANDPLNENGSGSAPFFGPTATGFKVTRANDPFTNVSGQTYIYIAIRRGPMKVPTSGTSVFEPEILPLNSASTVINAGLTADMVFGSYYSNESNSKYFASRLTGLNKLDSTFVYAEAAGTYYWDNMVGVRQQETNNQPAWFFFRRAPGFFDEVCYTGTGANRTVAHNLGVAPELMIVKSRSTTTAWEVYSSSLLATQFLELNSTAAAASSTALWNSTRPSSSVFTVGSSTSVNGSSTTYVNYLFATCPGVSKVGSYTGTGTTQQINCGFTAGSRFVLIKRTDSTGDWYVWDSARGIVAGNDPYLLLNSVDAEVTGTDYIDTYSAGFEISSTAPAAINASGGTFIYLAIA